MNKKVIIINILFLVAATVTIYGDWWGTVEQTEFFSPKRKHMLKIQPHKDWPNKPGRCKATLFKIEGKKRTEVWTRYLINNHAPVKVFVADSGSYVLTMDEWHNVGELPVVIYGRRGELVRVHSTDSLGLTEDILHIKITVSSFWWNEDSISFFGPSEEVFIIRLHWGKILFLNLEDGDLMDEEWYQMSKEWLMPKKKWTTLHQYASEQIKKQALLLLDSDEAQDRNTGAIVCKQEKIESAAPRLRELLKDKEYYTTNVPKKWTRVYYVRKSAKEALESFGYKINNVVIEEPDER